MAKGSWDSGPDRTPDERSEVAEQMGIGSPARRKKNTRTWCRGKKGRSHTPEMVMARLYQDLYARAGKELHCEWVDLRYGKGDKVWRCYHNEICSTCGRILRSSVGDFCPDYKPQGAML